MQPITYSVFSQCLTSAGALLALLGVLLTNPREILDASLTSDDRPGMITAISMPSLVRGFLTYQNKAILGIIAICGGFIFNLSVFGEKIMPFYLLVFLVVLFSFLFILVPGWTRRNVIKEWNSTSCKINWFIRFLDEQYFSEWIVNNESEDNLNNILVNFRHIKIALNLDIELSWQDDQNPTSTELKAFRANLADEVKNTGRFYYLSRPKKLLAAYK